MLIFLFLLYLNEIIIFVLIWNDKYHLKQAQKYKEIIKSQ